MNQRFIYLASASPRRRALLDQLGVRYRVHPVEIDEQRLEGESPDDCVRRLARAKAAAACAELTDEPDAAVLGADTVVEFDGELFGKPQDRAQALAMLRRLSGSTHRVLTAVALIAGRQRLECLSVSEVSFCELSEEQRRRYWESGEAADKAGAYALQGRAAMFVSHMAGSYSGVVGLPLYETATMLAQIGIELP